MRNLFIVLTLSVLCHALSAQQNKSFSGPYLGQTPPGIKSEVFASGLISTNFSEGTIWFSECGLQLVLCRWAKEEGIQMMEQKNGVWGAFELFPNTMAGYDGDFLLSPDGNKMVFASQRPVTEEGEKLKFCFIYLMEKKNEKWSKPIKLNAPINSGQHDSYPCLTNNGNLYFFSNRVEAKGGSAIFLSKPNDGEYKTVEQLGKSINTEYLEFDAFVSPDESYMIFCSNRPGGVGGEDMYISFKDSNGDWIKAVNMGNDINTAGDDWTPFVTLDGEYLFFSSNVSGNRDVYWVDAKVIDNLKPNNLK